MTSKLNIISKIEKNIIMNIISKIYGLFLFLLILVSCTDLDEDLRGVITSDISVEGIVTDSGGGEGGDILEGA